jgi:hypothetical protein
MTSLASSSLYKLSADLFKTLMFVQINDNGVLEWEQALDVSLTF